MIGGSLKKKKRTEFGREDAFVVDGSLGVRHDVVDVLRRRQSDLLTSFVNPCILSAKQTNKQTKRVRPKRNLCDCLLVVCVYVIIHQKQTKIQHNFFFSFSRRINGRRKKKNKIKNVCGACKYCGREITGDVPTTHRVYLTK